MIRLIAKAASHAAARTLDQLGLGVRNHLQDIEDRAHRAKGLLVAMAVQQDRLAGWFQGELQAPGVMLARDELLKHERLLGDNDGLLAQVHRQRLVAQREQA